MEFHVWTTARPHDLLLDAVRLVEETIQSANVGGGQGTCTDLERWVWGNSAARFCIRLGVSSDERRLLFNRLQRFREQLEAHSEGEIQLEAVVRQASARDLVFFTRLQRSSSREGELPVRLWETIDRVHDLKLSQLRAILETEDLSGGRQLAALYAVLPNPAVANEEPDRERIERHLLEAISTWYATLGHPRPRGYLGGCRIEEICSLSTAAADHKNRVREIAEQPAEVVADRECEYIRGWHYTALGRFDRICIQLAGPMTRSPLPRLDRHHRSRSGDNLLEENFFPFFERRELGIRVALRCGNSQRAPFVMESGRETPDVLAILSIILGNRNARLTFLARLLRALDVGAPIVPEGKDILEFLAPTVIRPYDFAYLAEGMGDILLVFHNGERGAGQGARLSEVMQLAVALFNDFMVERTELVMFASALGAVREEPTRFTLTQEVRLQENRDLQPAVSRFLRDFEESMTGNAARFEDCVRIVPGRFEFLVRYPAELLLHLWRDVGEGEEGSRNTAALLRALNKLVWTDTSVVDKTQTTVGLGPRDVLPLG